MDELPRRLSGEKPTCKCRRSRRHGLNPWAGKILWRRKCRPTLAFLSGKFHGQRNLVGYGPRGHRRVGHDSVTNNPTWVLNFVWFPQIHEFSVCAFACKATSIEEALSTPYLPAQAAPVQESVSLSSAKVFLNCAPTNHPAHFSRSTYFIILLSFV